MMSAKNLHVVTHKLFFSAGTTISGMQCQLHNKFEKYVIQSFCFRPWHRIVSKNCILSHKLRCYTIISDYRWPSRGFLPCFWRLHVSRYCVKKRWMHLVSCHYPNMSGHWNNNERNCVSESNLLGQIFSMISTSEKVVSEALNFASRTDYYRIASTLNIKFSSVNRQLSLTLRLPPQVNLD